MGDQLHALDGREQPDQAALNASFQTVAAANLNGIGSAQVAYEFKNFRGGTRSRSSQTYLVDYRVVSTGTAADGVRRVEDLGVLEIQLGKPSLSQYLFLVDNAQGNNGFFPTGTVFNGPVHANGNWGFWGKPVFMDTVTTAADGAYFWNAGGTCSGATRRTSEETPGRPARFQTSGRASRGVPPPWTCPLPPCRSSARRWAWTLR